jgi:serine/threonine-protein kinase HipA
MASNEIIQVHLFGQEVGKIGLSKDGKRSSFQYNPTFLQRNTFENIFPQTGILKRVEYVQLFNQFDNETFKGIPPQFADSLPDRFGSIIFKAWLDQQDRQKISVLEQLAYVGNRGMGALEYRPRHTFKGHFTIDLNEVIDILKDVLDVEKKASQNLFNHQSLLNIFKIGSSAGGARPKVLISEEKRTGTIIPGDLEYSNQYNHYLVKLALDEQVRYPREIVEFCYYLIATKAGIHMMDSKLIDNKHFATLRFDRQDGEKKHVLTASGITGWDFKSVTHSSYENLFTLASFLKQTHATIEELFRRMVFNVVYGNLDDHLKNHSFVYQKETDEWQLSPAYDLTFSLNPLIHFNSTQRALSINGKRSQITANDVLKLADEFTIKNPRGIIKEIQSYQEELICLFDECGVPKGISEKIKEHWHPLF